MIPYIILGVCSLLVLYALITYNSLVKLKNLVEEAFATMDVYAKKRWDLVPNLVETVKGYASHEQETLNQIVTLRGSSYGSMSLNEKIDTNQKLSQGISKLLALSEAYPDLKANENFRDLNKQLVETEEDIAQSRKYYNGTVRKINTKIQMFPSNLIAAMTGFHAYSMYEISEGEREAVNVSFH